MTRQYVVGVGAGQCGLPLLAHILQSQTGAQVAFDRSPLPAARGDAASFVTNRVFTWNQVSGNGLVGDVSGALRPYLEAFRSALPELRVVSLVRGRDETIAAWEAALAEQLDGNLNHWTTRLDLGWGHDPVESRAYPKYDEPSRATAIGRYWDEYQADIAAFARKFPENVLTVPSDDLTQDAGVTRLLDFLGIPRGRQRVVVGGRPDKTPQRVDPDYRPKPDRTPGRCAVLVPYSGSIAAECEASLRELERRGYVVRRVAGYSAIDQGRSQMATDALRDGFLETFWIDSDIGFEPDDVDRLRASDYPIICGLYPQKGQRALACHVLPGTPSLTFGRGGSCTEILYAGAGFLLIRREVYSRIQMECALPVCNERYGRPLIPWFQPMTRPDGEYEWYLAEDFAFCERARRCGYAVMADTRVRLAHIGVYRYRWEDAGTPPASFETFTLNLD